MLNEPKIHDEDVQMYLSESREMIEEVEPSLIQMGKDENNPENHEMINMIFRTFHTIKGSSSFFDYNYIVSLTHQAETLLDKIRAGSIDFKSTHSDVLCRACDVLNILFNQIEKTGNDQDFENQVEQIIVELEYLADIKPIRKETKKVNILSLDRNYTIFFDVVKQLIKENTDDCRSVIEKIKDEIDYNYIKKANKDVKALKESAGLLQIYKVKEIAKLLEEFISILYDHLEVSKDELNVLMQSFEMITIIIEELENEGTYDRIEYIVEKYLDNLSDIVRAVKNQISQSGEISLKENFDHEVISISTDMAQLFVQEALDQLDSIEENLIDYLDNQEIESVKEIFRLFHSFKGACGFMNYEDPEIISHGVETYLENIIDKKDRIKESHQSFLLEIVNLIRSVVKVIAVKGDSKIENRNSYLNKIEEMSRFEEIKPQEIIKTVEKEKVVEGIKTKTKKKVDHRKKRQVLKRDIRVNISKLDELVDLIGELVIAEAMVINNPDIEGFELENFERSATHLNKIVRDLQDVALSVRMIPISGIFRKMIRLVHDMSKKSSKKINLKLLGEDTEIDKTVAELIADPLVHLVRNAIDHGIEGSDERKRDGKNEAGELILEAKHEGNEVWIVVRDDGGGLNKEKIKSKGIEKGIIQHDVELDDNELYELIFAPGISTSDQVTEISGRGVGMDVVKKNIENINGNIDVFSYEKKGTMFVIRIPLTLAIIEGMLVRVGSSIYTIPLLSIRESIQIENDEVTETIDGNEMVRVRDELIPIIRLHELYSITPDFYDLKKGLLVIVEYHKNSFCLFIDEILGEQQTVIKGMSKYIDQVKGISGCTILGDGEISLILDIGGLLKRSQKMGTNLKISYN
ncbi:MAG: chemotaxis protein CheA [Deltaproteobacteria bacterium]|nr:chemotaxis protein CheA [Deltaproteobacteria bacterium]